MGLRSAGDREIAPCRENVSCVYIVGKAPFMNSILHDEARV